MNTIDRDDFIAVDYSDMASIAPIYLRRSMTDSSSRMSFMQSILEDVDNDVPRLIYADWLEENGDALRAEFIRIQCALSSEALNATEQEELILREAEILEANQARWVSELPKMYWGKFRRGFVENARIRASQIRKFESGFWLQTPLLELELSKVEEEPKVFQVKSLQKLRSLKLGPDRMRLFEGELSWGSDNRLADEPLRELIQTSWLSNLHSLDVSEQGLSAEEIRQLAESNCCKNLRNLNLDYNDAKTSGAEAIVKASGLSQLESLSIAANEIGPQGMAAIAGAKKFKRLKKLDVHGNPAAQELPLLGDQGMEYLSKATFTELEELIVWSNQIGDAGFATLMASPSLRQLKSLELGPNPITEEGFTNFKNAVSLNCLEKLDLRYMRPGECGMAALATGPTTEMRCLHLDHCSFVPVGSRMLSQAGGRWPNLKKLNLSHNQIGDEGLTELCRSGIFRTLECLNLTANQLSLESVKLLSRNRLFEQLDTLTITNNQIGDQEIFALIQADWFQNLRTLIAARDEITNDGIQRLATAPQVQNLRCLELGNVELDGNTAKFLLDCPYLRKLRRLKVSLDNVEDSLAERFKARFGQI